MSDSPPHPLISLFDNPDDWQVVASGQAVGQIQVLPSEAGKHGLRLEYDFHGGGGFVVMRRILRFPLPQTFTIGFQIRGHGPRNHFEFKVASPGGANVWRHLRPEFALPSDWQQLAVTERELPFAWGPAGGGSPSDVEAVEIVIAAGPGGRGVLDLAEAWLADESLNEPTAIRASSHRQEHTPEMAFLGTGTWQADPADLAPWWAIDFGRPLRFGGLVIEWPENLPPRAYRVETMRGEGEWTAVYQATHAMGPLSHISLPGHEANQLRVVFNGPAGATLRSVRLKPDSFAATPNEFIHSVAADFPRGWFPRYWHREQSYWTPVGSPDGRRRALINEEGMVEIDEGGFSLEPVLWTDNGMLTWAEVEATPALELGGLPMPSVTWRSNGLRLEILPWVDGEGDDLTLRITYRLHGVRKAKVRNLAVVIRPFQVNPPWQAFRNLGGRSPIDEIRCESNTIRAAGRPVMAYPQPDALGAAAFEEGGVMAFLARNEVPPHHSIDDDSGLASAAMVWEIKPDQATFEVTLAIPYFKQASTASPGGRPAAIKRWRKTLGSVQWKVPACATPAIDCFRSAAGQILINRDGPAIQPGPRRYTRSWVRDCVIMGAALAKAGLPDALKQFLVWYAPFQRDDGFIPCVVDRDGIDWLVEHDSHGQFLWGVREWLRQCRDPQFLKQMIPHVRMAAHYLVQLRGERLRDDQLPDGNRACRGLLPESASHEGYLAHPVHSYWDDFWGIRGMEAAADLTEKAGRPAEARRWRDEAAAFQRDVITSLETVIADKKLNYIPGSVEWADFDPTATSNAIAMLDFADALPAAPLEAMLETYLDGFRRKHRGDMPWNNYTAYEIRIIGAFVRLGKRDIANELLAFFLSDRRPTAWNQWPEITWRDPRSPGHLGDIPHTWIAAEYLLVVASMVAAEREASTSLVLAAGMPWSWIADDDGFAVKHLPTRFGRLNFSIHAQSTEHITLRVGGRLKLPPGGLIACPPLPPETQITAIHCEDADSTARIRPDQESIEILSLPAIIELQLTRRPSRGADEQT